MKWWYLIVTVVSSTAGDLLTAKAMAAHGEIQDFGTHAFVRLMRYMTKHPLVIEGIVCNAISFFTFMALLSVAELSFAVPATALGYILKTMLAEWYLGERVTARRWLGAVLVAAGVVLIAL